MTAETKREFVSKLKGPVHEFWRTVDVFIEYAIDQGFVDAEYHTSDNGFINYVTISVDLKDLPHDTLIATFNELSIRARDIFGHVESLTMGSSGTTFEATIWLP